MSEWRDYIIKESNKDDKLTKKQQNILIAAIELISEVGYDKVSTAEIAKRAGVAEGTIFRQYKTKKGLLDAVVFPAFVRFMAPKFIKDFSNKVLNKDYITFEIFIRTVIEDRFEFAKRETPLLKILVQELISQEYIKSEIGKLFIEHGYPKIKKIIDVFKEKGEIDDIPNMTVIRILLTTILGYLIPRFILYPNLDWNDEYEKEILVNTIIKSLKPNNK